ncbi:MAG: sugar ABC transporter permease, partial [Planctomycetota bacterium]
MRRPSFWPWLMLAPLLAGFALIYVYPLAHTLWMSTRHAPGTSVESAAGFDHYAAALRDPLLWLAVANTVGFAVAFIVIQLPIALGLALLLNGLRGRSRGLWRLAFFSTHLVGSAFAGVLLQTMLTGRRGFFNAVLLRLGLVDTPVGFLTSPSLAMPILIAAAVWLGAGFAMIYLLAALSRVDRDQLDAA